MTRDKAIDRINKLLGLAHAAGTEHEAAAASAAVQRLLAEYRLTLDDVARDQIVEITVRLETGWPLQLFSTVAGGCGCVVVALSSAILGPIHLGKVVGTQLDCGTAVRLYYRTKATLTARLEDGWTAYVAGLIDPIAGRHPILDEPETEANWREGFASGAIDVIRRTLAGKDVPHVQGASLSTEALIRVTASREGAYAKSKAYVKQRYASLGRADTGVRAFGLGAFRQGKDVKL